MSKTKQYLQDFAGTLAQAMIKMVQTGIVFLKEIQCQ